MSASRPAEPVVCELRLRIGGESIDCRAPLPAGPIRVAGLLPALHALTDAVVDAGVRQAAREGKAVSCRKGCGACCRQPVPIAEAEAVALAELVAAMPAERQAAVRERFARGIDRLAGAGLLDAVRGLGHLPDGDERHRLGHRYFLQQIPCPFLEAEACSIHPRRPLACREYLVTSPAAHCSTPDRTPVERLALPGKVSHALYRFGDGSGLGPPRWVPLLLALEWAEAHRRFGQRRYGGAALFQRFLEHLAGVVR